MELVYAKTVEDFEKRLGNLYALCARYQPEIIDSIVQTQKTKEKSTNFNDLNFKF